MKRVLVILIFIFGCCAFSFARQRDSSVLASGHFEYPQKLTTWDGEPLTRDGVRYRTLFKPTQLIAPAALLTSGLIIHNAFHETLDYNIRNTVQGWRGDTPDVPWDDYVQYLPHVLDLGLAFTGIPAQHGFVDRLLVAATASLTCMCLSWGTKNLIKSMRPNGANEQSFPSGHSCTVFMGAELVRMEYGPWWGLGAYTVAVAVGCSRIWRDWHWFSDVLMGAGFGILSAHVGGWLLEPIKSLCHIKTMYWGSGRHEPRLSFAPRVDPFTGSVCASLSVVF